MGKNYFFKIFKIVHFFFVFLFFYVLNALFDVFVFLKIWVFTFTIFEILKIVFFETFDFGAFYGPLLGTIVLVAKSCVDRSCSELWRSEHA